MTEERCGCPDAYPDWDGTTVNLGGYCVHEMKIPTFFHMPMAYDMYVSKQAENIHQLGLTERWPGFILTKTGMVGGKIIRILENEQSPSRLVHFIAGDFLLMAQMHEGGIGSVPKAAHKMQQAMIEKGCMPKELYLAHLTCDFCRDAKGGDKVLMLRRYTANTRVQQKLEDEAKKVARKAAKKAEKAAKEAASESAE